ncbi:hypothetical protein GCM10007390_04420 [Persicitalea jodogahamensis]|uniref:CAAX prenyl protease 2/Lysostaphin resistance protein A-like domain-containing protein n=2 Tax=Persicitalea jodogahamensis TaxID=402147 RepID=A0A8J3D1Q4_9BACT|nr:CPBP family glutamic-type intramembrane protease [Persicitalea jodogahamensis]GHB54501.1 hypothetical protein GCM10007390_04420 [Persicitalea jodogahamensis]
MPHDTFTIQFILRDFWRFLKKPECKKQAKDFSLSPTLKLFLALLIIRFIGIILEINGFQPLILHFTGEELQKQVHADYGIADRVVGSLISAPLFEELAYRWGLRFSPLRTAASLGLIVFYWLPYGGTYSTTIIEVLDDPGFYLMVGMALITGLTAYALFSISVFEQPIRRWWEQNFGWVFYTSSLLFGLMHVFNVSEVTATVVTLAFFITFQQITMGLFNGYVRMRYGFGQAILQHSLFNLLPVLIGLLQ